MRTIVMGGGQVGSYLIRELRSAGEAVILIERDPIQARKVAEETGVLTIEGDGTDVELLAEIDVRVTDFFVAVTGADEVNLVACQLARTAFNTQRLLARLNDPRNRATFDALDIPVVSVTDLLVDVISRELDVGSLTRVALIERGQVSVFEVDIPEAAQPVALSDLTLPQGAVVVAIFHRGDTIIPNGAASFGARDRLLMAANIEVEDEARNAVLAAGTAAADTGEADFVLEKDES